MLHDGVNYLWWDIIERMKGIVWGYNKLWKIEAKLEDGFCPTWGEMTLDKDGKKSMCYVVAPLTDAIHVVL